MHAAFSASRPASAPAAPHGDQSPCYYAAPDGIGLSDTASGPRLQA